MEWPLQHANMYAHLGVSPPRGILLHGPPGCGKSLLATAIAGELGVTFLKVSGPEIVSGVSGESERKLRNVFEEAVRLQPSILFVDEVDAIASRREGASKDMERRIVSQLLSCVDQLGVRRQVREKMDGEVKGVEKGEIESSAKSGDESSLHVDVDVNDGTGDCVMGAPSVVVIAATNRPECLEPALRRAGRFDREIELGAPDETARAAIISKLSRNLRLGADFEVGSLAKRSAGYVGADLGLLIKEAGLACIRRFAKTRAESRCASRMDESEMADVEDVGRMKRKITGKELENLAIEMCDFQQALDTIQPSALREGFATRPDVSWDNVGSLECVREEMMMAIVQPIRHPHMFSSVGLHAPAGVLLYGPPGCGKTLLARAVASESGANFISVKGPELLSKYVGDSELAVRKVFARARSSCPCVIFFDELDALAPRRGSGGADSGASERVVNMLLTEMDGFTDRKQVFLIAATNRPDIIDPAMLRPGRLDKLIFVPLPDEKGRASILRTLLRGVQVCDEVDVDEISRKKECQGFSGADLQAVIRVAGECALRERMKMGDVGDVMTRIEQRHFDAAVQNVVPSVSPRDARLYCDMQGWLRNSRGNLERRND